MSNQSTQRPFSQRQLRVGELVKQNLGELFLRNEAKIPTYEAIDLNEYGDFEDSFVNKNDNKEDMIMATKDMMVIEPWIILESKRFPGYYYFYNTESNEKQWRMPSNIVKVEKIFDSTPTKTTADNYSPTFQEWVDNKPQSATTFQLDNRSPNYTSPPMRYVCRSHHPPV